MASGDDRASLPDLDATGLRIGIIGTRWNENVVKRLLAGARRACIDFAIADITELTVPGAYELPLAAKLLARSGSVDGIVVLGAVVRGETTHYELVAGECGRAIMDVQLATEIPIGMGVLTVENLDQAMARSEDAGGHNVGEEATIAAIELAVLGQSLSSL